MNNSTFSRKRCKVTTICARAQQSGCELYLFCTFVDLGQTP